jgi:hypothetical protein
MMRKEARGCKRFWSLKLRSPQAKALCDRLLGTLRWECLNFMIPLRGALFSIHSQRFSCGM